MRKKKDNIMIIKNLKNKHITRCGNPLQKGGALYFVTDQEGLCQMAVDILLFQCLANNEPINQKEKEESLNEVKFMRDVYNSKIAKKGIPEKFLKLFNISKKSKVDQFAKQMNITEFELFLLIRNCYFEGFNHRSKFPDYVPQHLVITDFDKNELEEGNVKPVSKKLDPLLIYRRRINVHMISKAEKWHCFYFDYNDINNENNHWKQGEHIHYISYLWPNLSEEEVWDSFDTRKTKLPNPLHIHFSPFKDPETFSRNDYPQAFRENKLGSFAFDVQFTSDIDSFPIPPAQIATKGFWVSKIFIKKQI